MALAFLGREVNFGFPVNKRIMTYDHFDRISNLMIMLHKSHQYSYIFVPSGRGRLTLTRAAELARPK